MNRKELLDEIINLKERRRVLEVECGESTCNIETFSKHEMHQMEEDMMVTDSCVALDIVSSMIEKDEETFRRI